MDRDGAPLPLSITPSEIAGSGGADAPEHGLFRAEALQAATTRYGVPVRPLGLAGWALTLFMLSLVVVVAVFLVFSRYARKETVVGVIQPTSGAARVTSLRPGVVSEVFVTEGEVVEMGDPILALSSDIALRTEGGLTYLSSLVAQGSDAEAQALVEQARAAERSAQQSRAELQARREGLVADQHQLAVSIDMQRQRIRLAEETLASGQALHERQLFSTLQLRQREEAVIAARQGLGALERELRRNAASIRQLEAEEGQLLAETGRARAEIAQAQSQLAQREAQREADSALVLPAARSGRVVALQARPGAPVQAGSTLAVVLPPGETLQAELWVPSRAAGFLEQGDEVRLMYDAFPYQKFGVGSGIVASIAGAPTNPSDLPIPLETNEALYRVVVDLRETTVAGYGRRWPLTPGMRLSADLILEERSLVEWLFDPIIAARRRSK